MRICLHERGISSIFIEVTFVIQILNLPTYRYINHFVIPSDYPFLDEAIRVLKVDGTLELRTDSKEYYEYGLEVFEEPKISKLLIHKNRDLEVSSKYEDRWRRQEKDIYDLIFTNNKC